MLNRITMTGRLTADPELHKTQSDVSVVSFSVANQRNFKNADGERDTDFFDVVAWRSTAEFVSSYFRKGSLITVDGRLQTRRYTDKSGNKRVATEIVADNVFFGDSKGNGETADAPASAGADLVPNFGGDAGSTVDEDLPFEFPTL